MKKIIFLMIVIVFLPIQAAHSQLIIEAPLLEGLMTASGTAQVIYYAQSVANFTESLIQSVATVENLVRQVEMATNNLSRIGNVRSFDDFMDWYNRQLYLERRSVETFDSMGVTIGKKNYKITDVVGMANGMDDTFGSGFWEKEFTEEQNREMWLGLGLTASNYAYVQTWKAKERELAMKFLTSPTIKLEDYIDDITRGDEIMNSFASDKDKDIDHKIGEKELAAINAEMAVRNNKVLNEISMTLGDLQELKAVEMFQKNTPYDQPLMSPWETNGFRPLK
jgi:hypothetical protein